MGTRVRQSTATPHQRRPAADLPPYEAPTFSLNPAAQRALAQLKHSHNLKNLSDDLEEAQGALSNAAAEINERLTVKERAVEKRKARNEEQATQDGETEDTEDPEQALNDLRDKVERMTQRMDENMRKLIDGRHGVQAIQESLDSTANDARANASTQASTQNVRSQRTRRRGSGLEDDDEEEDDEEYQDFTPTDPTGGTQAQPTPIEAFRSKVENAKTRYQSYSLTSRYGENNDYRSFRGVVHDARNPEGDVPLPHHTEWFDEGQAPAPGVTTRAHANAEDDDDDDIAVSRATISTKCPLTLQEFKKPLSSKKCPHSFESEAIMSMISRSNVKEGSERVVQCPVSGCAQRLSRHDLQNDAVLVRKIKRLQRAKEMAEEEAEDDEDSGRPGTQRPTVIRDDEDGADVDDIVGDRVIPATQMKIEAKGTASTARPGPTVPRSSAAVVDLGSSEDEAEEHDGDETMTT